MPGRRVPAVPGLEAIDPTAAPSAGPGDTLDADTSGDDPTNTEPAWDDVVWATSREVSSPVCDAIGILGLDPEIYRDPGSTGARVWALVRQPIRVSEIHRRIVEETGVDAEALRVQVLEVLAQLRAAALIEVGR